MLKGEKAMLMHGQINDPPMVILERLADLERDIAEEQKELEELLK